jgi:hypothetical protein
VIRRLNESGRFRTMFGKVLLLAAERAQRAPHPMGRLAHLSARYPAIGASCDGPMRRSSQATASSNAKGSPVTCSTRRFLGVI